MAPAPKQLHITMFPWIAMGHITTFVHVANELTKRGHSVSFLLPQKALLKLRHITNLHSDRMIKFHILTVPPVPGLPPGAETTADIDLMTHGNPLAVAFDAMHDQVDALLRALTPDVVFFDFAHWVPQIASRIGNIRTVCYQTFSASAMAILSVPSRVVPLDRPLTDDELVATPPGYPSATVAFRRAEADRGLSFLFADFGAIRMHLRVASGLKGCDAIGIRTCRELEGPTCDYLSAQFGNKPVLLSGPALPVSQEGRLKERWDTWLNKFERKSVVYCCFGSQTLVGKAQFQELVLGFEMTGLPFFIALSKPHDADSIEEALLEGFLERVGERGVVHGGWVQQTRILAHPSVGCFVSHCGFGSMWESLLCDTQIVLVPHLADQILNTRILGEELKVAVEVERGKMGWFSKEDLCKAIKSVMDEDSEVGKLVKENHAKWRETLVSPGYMDNYIDNFIQQLYGL